MTGSQRLNEHQPDNILHLLHNMVLNYSMTKRKLVEKKQPLITIICLIWCNFSDFTQHESPVWNPNLLVRKVCCVCSCLPATKLCVFWASILSLSYPHIITCHLGTSCLQKNIMSSETLKVP